MRNFPQPFFELISVAPRRFSFSVLRRSDPRDLLHHLAAITRSGSPTSVHLRFSLGPDWTKCISTLRTHSPEFRIAFESRRFCTSVQNFAPVFFFSFLLASLGVFCLPQSEGPSPVPAPFFRKAQSLALGKYGAHSDQCGCFLGLAAGTLS